jgi:alkanesulfonate monooxygenase SsuD/methylene tetrahydromethanopterin reductase-like flavin-dependent oxidoreductase (luciferase family)
MDQQLRFGLCVDQNLTWPETVSRFQRAEELGFDSVWDCDHYQQPSRPTGPYFEGWTLLAALAVVTKTIRLGCLVSCNTFRHPALIAKEAVTVDHISQGRLDFGLGAGWFVEEHERFGLGWPAAAELVQRFRESVEICDSMFRNELTSYRGRYFQLIEAPCRPRPIQQPRPRVMLAGHRPRMLRIVAEYADAWNSFGTVDELRERNLILDEQCHAIRRDPRTISRSLYGWASILPYDPWSSVDAFIDCVERYREVGINEFIIDYPPDDQVRIMERVAVEVIPGLRAAVRAR